MCNDNQYEGLTHKFKDSIADVVNRLGQGLCDPVPYDTAWVARVPRIDNTSLPAFPLSLQWLRNHQLEDGSWGDIQPFSPHSLTLNTLAAIIALAQWNNPEDKIRIQRGVKALWSLVDHLPSEVHSGICFELILPALQKEARKFELNIPHEHYTVYEEDSKKKLNLILAEFRKYGHRKPATWWYSLEILGDNVQMNVNGHALEFCSSMITKGGSVAVSPSATAYLLRTQRLKGLDIPEAANYLQEIYSLFQGGISQVFPIDIFEVAFSLDFFFKAGLSAKDPLFKEAISCLAKNCKLIENTTFSSHFKVPDSDDMSLALSVLLQAGYQLSPDPVLTFFNGTHIVTFINEINPSVGTNINAINVLKLFRDVKKVDKVIQTVLRWIDIYVSKEQILIGDKWNSSPFYGTSRAVFALHGLRDDIVRSVLDFFIKSINEDGGWGRNGNSTAEETAYVSLALVYALKCGFDVPETVLEKASGFLFNPDKLKASSIWIGKVLYRPTMVAESAIVSAQYALAKTLESTRVKSI